MNKKPVILTLGVYSQIPKDVVGILTKLYAHGYDGYIVGGAVRSFILGLEPHDYDIVTNATPSEVKALFPTSSFVGESFGVSIVKGLDGESYEVATYRHDGSYINGRSPESVNYTKSLEEDLSRRDFTMNALIYDIRSGEVKDYFGGIEDIHNRIITCIGEPFHRLVREDCLRMLRAIRFAAQYNMTLSKEVIECIRDNKNCISSLSAERIRSELNKILINDHPSYGITLLKEAGILEIIIPGIDKLYDFDQNNQYHHLDAFKHTLKTLVEDRRKWELTEKELLVVNLSLLLHDIGKPKVATVGYDGFTHYKGHPEVSKMIALNTLTALKYSNEDIKNICTLVSSHDMEIPKTMTHLRRLIARLGSTELFELWRVIRVRDVFAHKDYNGYFDKYRGWLANLLILYYRYKKEKTVLTTKDLNIKGYDLMNLGLVGTQIGEMQKQLLTLFLDGEINNSKEELIEAASQLIKG